MENHVKAKVTVATGEESWVGRAARRRFQHRSVPACSKRQWRIIAPFGARIKAPQISLNFRKICAAELLWLAN
jgi:hypothetical protein